MDERKKYAFVLFILAWVQRQRCLMLLLLARRSKRKRETFTFGCRPVYEAPPRRPRFYVKRRPRYGGPVDEDGRQLRGNKAWFRPWDAMSTFADYINLTPPSAYEPPPENEKVRRKEFEKKIRLPYATFYSLYLRMKDDPLMQERSTAVPLKWKLIAALRYLAIGVPWDACEDIFNVDKRTLRDFFFTGSSSLSCFGFIPSTFPIRQRRKDSQSSWHRTSSPDSLGALAALTECM